MSNDYKQEVKRLHIQALERLAKSKDSEKELYEIIKEVYVKGKIKDENFNI